MSLLSKSRQPAYHLRPNKAIDRFIFLELLRTLELKNPIGDYKYIGLGGPFLEDFRLLSHQFPMMELICVEQDSEIIKRQRFHVCSSKLHCVSSTLGSYIATQFPTDRPVIIWADYNDMTRECLCEIADIVRKAVPGSLLRFTIRAESPVPWKLKLSPHLYPSRVPSKRDAEFQLIKKNYLSDLAIDGIVFPPEWFQWSDFSLDKFPRLLARMIGAIAYGSCTNPKTYLPLHTVKYSDGTIMLSITGLVCLADQSDSYKRHFRDHFSLGAVDINEVDEIDVPSLTMKERLCLEEILPTTQSSGLACLKKLGYLIDGDASEHESRRKMGQFEKYYRLYPYFGKIIP